MRFNTEENFVVTTPWGEVIVVNENSEMFDKINWALDETRDDEDCPENENYSSTCSLPCYACPEDDCGQRLVLPTQEPLRFNRKVESSIVSRISYRGTSLDVTLNNGRKYRYFNVDANTAAEFLSAESLGYYYNEYIKGEYESKKLS